MSAPLSGPPDRSSAESPEPAVPEGESVASPRPRRRGLLPRRGGRNPLRQSPATVPENLVVPPRPPLPPVVPPRPALPGEQASERGADADAPAEREPADARPAADAAAEADASPLTVREVDTSVPEPTPDPAPDVIAAPEPEVTPEPEPAEEPEPEPAPVVEPESGPDSVGAADAPALEIVWEGAAAASDEPALAVSGVTKLFGETAAVEDLTLTVPAGTFYGLVGPNGAGKTTTLSMIAGLLRPDAGSILVRGVDVRTHERDAKRLIGVLPDRLRTFDRLTGRQLLSYAGLLRGLAPAVVDERVAALTAALDLEEALGRVVSDYSAGMTKKLMLAAAMIHAPRLLVLDEPFEAVDPASSVVILDILRSYVGAGGTVILSSHGMDLVERVCDRVAIIAGGRLLTEGDVDEVRGEASLEERFIELVGAAGGGEGLEWLRTFSD